MRAGNLDRQVTIQTVTEATDTDFNGIEPTVATLATVWAERKDLAGRTYFAAGAENSQIDAVFRIRWRSDVTTKNRLVCEGKDYLIVSVAEIGRREALEIRAKARNDA